MQGDATGAGFLVGALCDFMICSREGNYYYTSPQEGLYPGEEEYQFFKERLGEVRATDFLYHSTGSTGRHLQEKGWNNPILPQDQVEAYAQELASSLAKKSESSLRLLKQHLSRHLISLVNALPGVTPLSQEQRAKAHVKIISPAKHIELTDEGSVLVIRLCVSEKAYGTKALTSDLKNIFTQINNSTQYKTIVLSSEHANFLPQEEEESLASAVLAIQDIVLQCRVPVLCILDSDTEGRGWFIGQFCDGCIYHAQGRYSLMSSWQKGELAKEAPMIFAHRFGSSFGKEIVLTGKAYTGFELQQRARTITVAAADKLLPVALQLAAFWSKLPWDTVVEWKKQMTVRVREKIKALPEWSQTEAASIKPPSSKPVSITLRSKVIIATAHPEGILEVKMEDREAKNMFSDAFVEGITEVFEHVEQRAEYKVVILTGYDTYFASGGTKESLLAIQEGKTRFTDSKIYHLAMACKVPVISAMQGHGIGAGWALGHVCRFHFV
jgi:enoyl-CoA hydratase/carnithine racemase